MEDTKTRMLEVVNEDGTVIGQDTRENIHARGLLHREIHVWLYTPRGGIIFQHRAKDKDTYPDLLDASIGGHVEIGDDYSGTALKELTEEAGIRATEEQLHYITTTRSRSFDEATKRINHALRAVFALQYGGRIQDLRVEPGKATGFEEWSFEHLQNISEEEKQRFIPMIFHDEVKEIFRKIRTLLS